MSEVTIRVLGIPLRGHVTFGFLQTPKVTITGLYVLIYLVRLLICFESLIDRVKILANGRGLH